MPAPEKNRTPRFGCPVFLVGGELATSTQRAKRVFNPRADRVPANGRRPLAGCREASSSLVVRSREKQDIRFGCPVFWQKVNSIPPPQRAKRVFNPRADRVPANGRRPLAGCREASSSLVVRSPKRDTPTGVSLFGELSDFAHGQNRPPAGGLIEIVRKKPQRFFPHIPFLLRNSLLRASFGRLASFPMICLVQDQELRDGFVFVEAAYCYGISGLCIV